MLLLFIGLLVWMAVHLFPGVCINKRIAIIERIGLKPYKGLFALLILSSLVMIVFGWRSTIPEEFYYPPDWGRHVTYLLVLLTFVLFVAAKRKTNIKRVLRHPQLTGLFFWSIGHLFANGEDRSILLFTMFGIWAVLEMIMINKREGAWKKPETIPLKNDFITLVIGCVLYVVLVFAHPYFTGMKVF